MYLTSDEAADRIGYAVNTLQYWRSHGGGPPFIRVHGRTIRYRAKDLDEWIESHGLRRSNKDEPESIVKRSLPRVRLRE